MKKIVSISIGSSSRDKHIRLDLLGEMISIQRIGTDGNIKKAMNLFHELDGKVDAFGIGGADLGLLVGEKYYPLRSINHIVKNIRKTPFTDGAGVRAVIERQVPRYLTSTLERQHHRVLLTTGTERWGLANGFHELGYECVFGDLMFGLGLPIPIKSLSQVKFLSTLLCPIVSYLPFHFLYPIGKQQEKIKPKFNKWYQWANIIAGDCHFIKRHMPDSLTNKIIVTNTTTQEDVDQFRKRGVSYLVTTTPCYENRTFGTNVLEATLIAISGKKRLLNHHEISSMIAQLDIKPSIRQLRACCHIA